MSKNRSIIDLVHHTEKSSDTLYGAKPSGRPDAERFVRSDPKPWIQPQYSEESKKKTLIVSNWDSLEFDVIKSLIAQGFAMYGCNGKDIFPITAEDCIPIPRYIESNFYTPLDKKFGTSINTLPNEAVVKLACSRYPLAKDQVQVVDTYALSEIYKYYYFHKNDEPLSPNKKRILNDKKRILNAAQLTDLQTRLNDNNQDTSIPYPMLQSLTPKIDVINHDVFSAQANALVSEHQHHLKEATVEVNIKEIALNERDLNTLMTRGQLTLNNATIRLDDLSNLKEIELLGRFTDFILLEKNLNTLLAKAKENGPYAYADLYLRTKTFSHFLFDAGDINECARKLYEHTYKKSQNTSDSENQKQATHRTRPSTRQEIPKHKPEALLTHKSTKSDFSFEYKGTNDTLNQGMIIEKFSQYLTLTNQHCEFIPKLQDGMCAALATLFIDLKLERWNKLVNQIWAWNGSRENLSDDLTIHFERILSQFKQTYVHGDATDRTYLGDNLLALFKSSNGPFKLNNAWHEISVKRISNTHWALYDPNYPDGYKKLAFDELTLHIDHSLGKLVSVAGNYNLAPQIDDIDAFIRDGGLLVLTQCSNSDAEKILAILRSKITTPFPKNSEVLQGLLLRCTSDKPAWVYLIQHKNPKINTLGIELLNQLISHHPNDYANKLINSLSALSEKEKYFAMEALISRSSQYPNLINKQHIESVRTSLHAIRPAFHDKKKAAFFDNEFETWKKTKARPESTLEFCQRLVSGEKQKCLIEFSSSETVQAMSFRLQQHCKSINRPVFYIHSPEDLVCMAPFIKREGHEGKMMKGPGGPLYDFLTAAYKSSNPPLLIVNYDNFKAEDMVAFNTLLDDSPLIDKTKLPENAIVVGLINTNKPDCYQGEDFYSRFGKQGVEVCSLSTEQILPNPKIINDVQKSESTSPTIINLCHAQNWKERLLGHYIIKQDKLYFEDGILAQALTDALKKGIPIEIQNGLWEDESFRFFWEQALALKRIIIDGKAIDISNVSFVKSDGYDPNLKNYATWDNVLHDKAITLNRGCFNDFFNRYQCNNKTNQLDTLPGHIEVHANQTLHVNVTRSLSQHEWATLLLECKKYNVQLQCHCAPQITLPEDGNFWTTDNTIVSRDTIAWNAKSSAPTAIINSSDVDTTIALMTQTEQDWKVIDISECSSNDLLMRLDGTFNKDTLRFEFTESACALAVALEKNEKIILKGRFSQELADALAPILLTRKANSNADGKLILISNETTSFTYLPVETHKVTKKEKLDVLSKQFSADKINALKNVGKNPLCHSIARLSYEAAQISAEPNPWQGTKSLPGGITLEPMEDDERKIKEKSDAFILHRQQGVNAILDHSPFVFLTGLTGVGKSTFIENDLLASTQKGHRNKSNTNLYLGESAMQAWAEDTSDKSKILFIDEANITSREWSEFEGLFQHPPGILIAGKYYPLTEKDKVIFAGNPLSYGGERKLAPLFERHGNALIFEPLPQEFIYEKILKPVFDKSPLEKSSLAIAKEILNTYKFLCACSTDSVLISPRELQMMASLVLSHSKEHPNDDPVATARRYAYLIAKSCVPDNYSVKFENRFSKFAASVPLNLPVNPTFLVTPSREPLYQQLNDLTALREYRRDNPQLNDAQKYGGLGGIVIEGEPGIGKSEFVKAHLITHGYKEVDITKPDATLPAKPFYHMPVGMSLTEKKKLLLNAFDQGAIVIIDEINSSPMMERLLNDLLMGKRPKSETVADNDRPIKPGFMVIGTQNPIAMSGRRAAGAALARRLINVTMPPYPPAEMEAILRHRGIDDATAKTMVASYIKKSEQARQEQKTPAPTFRDLLKTADAQIKAKASNTPDLVMTDKHVSDVNKTISIQSLQPLDDLAIYQIINTAIEGIHDYLGRNKSHLDWISSKFDSETGVNRASCFLDELQSSHSEFYKFVLLSALLTNTANSPTLVGDVLSKIQHKLNLGKSDLLRLIENDIINRCHQAFLSHSGIAIEYFHQHQTIINDVRVSVNKKGEIPKEIKKEIHNFELALENPKVPELITKITQTLGNMGKHSNPDIKALAKRAKSPNQPWHSIREQCEPQASSGWSFFQPEPRDAFTNLLYNSIANFEQNLHFNGKIKNLADLMLAEQERSQKSKTSTGPKISEGEIMKSLGMHPSPDASTPKKVTNR